jgi:hypothetical protein
MPKVVLPKIWLAKILVDVGLVWFMPKVVLPKIWLAKILVDVLLANELANIGYKNELELVMRHWHAK